MTNLVNGTIALASVYINRFLYSCILSQACIDETFDLVKILVSNGARLDIRDNEGWTPLHAAASCGSVDIAK